MPLEAERVEQHRHCSDPALFLILFEGLFFFVTLSLFNVIFLSFLVFYIYNLYFVNVDVKEKEKKRKKQKNI